MGCDGFGNVGTLTAIGKLFSGGRQTRGYGPLKSDASLSISSKRANPAGWLKNFVHCKRHGNAAVETRPVPLAPCRPLRRQMLPDPAVIDFQAGARCGTPGKLGT